MNSKASLLFLFLFILIRIKADPKQIYVTPNRTCGKACIGDLANPFDNVFFALQSASLANLTTSIILLGDPSAIHYLLPKEINQSNPNSLLYDFTNKTKFTLGDIEIKPLFCDDIIVKNNISLLNKCVDRNQSITVAFKPIDITLTITKKLSVKNIVFDWTESSQTVNSSWNCARMRQRCCNTLNFSSGIECSPKFYTKQPADISKTYNFIELGSANSTARELIFEFVALKNFRDKTMKSFIQTNGNSTFQLTIQNSIIDDITFGQGFISHIGAREDMFSSSIKLDNVNVTKYNYWNRDEETSFGSWKEGYILWANTNFKGNISISNSNFVDMNAASMYTCEVNSSLTGNFLLDDYPISRSNIWNTHHNRISNKESSVILIDRLDGALAIQNSTFEKIIGLYGSVVQVKDCLNTSSFTFIDNKFENNFGMQGFANVLIVTAGRPVTEPAVCPLVRVENCSFTNSKGCPGSFGNVGFICYWDTLPSYKSPLLYANSVNFTLQAQRDSVFDSPQIQISKSKFQNNLIPICNSLVIIGTYFTSLIENQFLQNGGTTAEIILYSLNDSNFLEKKPKQYYISKEYDWKSYYASSYFGQSTAAYIDRLFKIESTKNIFQGNWGPWEGSLVLGAALTVRTWIPFRSEYLKFKDDKYLDHTGIPVEIAQNLGQYGAVLKNNSYTPPLFTIAFDPKDSYRWTDQINNSYIVFDGVEFNNNVMSFNIDSGCLYNSNQIGDICSMMKDKRRCQTGLLKFVSESELREDSEIDFMAMDQPDEISLSLKNVKIINNTLLTDGCLFSTLWVEKFLVDNVIIENNTVSPKAIYFTESVDYSGPLLDLPFKNRNGLFCAFKRETIYGTMQTIIIDATNLRVSNNYGTIFNLYPDEISQVTLLNSIFINNTVHYGPVIDIFENSKLISQNNIFIRNNNSLGIFFLTSQYSFHYSISNVYLKNNGRHASISYVNDKAQSVGILSKHNWNTVKPSFLTFKDRVTPQGGLYFLKSAQVRFILADFKENYPYAGFIVSLKSTISFDLTNISDHYISGNSVIGNMYSSFLVIRGMKISNNSLTYLPSFENTQAIMVLEKVKFYADSLEISKTFSSNQTTFLLGTKIQGSIKYIKFYKFYSNKSPLIRLDFSNLDIQNLTCINITSLFKLSETVLTLQNVRINNLLLSSSARFLMNMIDTTLSIKTFDYFGGLISEDHSSLFIGSNTNLKITESNFENAVKGASKVFELSNSNSFFIARTKFIYTSDFTQTMIFYLTSINEVKIQECLFILAGQVIQANNIFSSLYFVRNIILTNSNEQNAKIIGANVTYLIDNIFLRKGINQANSLPSSQLNFLNSLGPTSINNNFFISLYGSKGIVRIQALTHPYDINTSTNIFIENTGSSGGAFHLDASLSETSALEQIANIDNSIFIKNIAINLQDSKGKGGAIFQTTSNLMNQATRITKSIFIKNSADTIGGALFFNYLPLKVDSGSIFKDNYANRPNHIGSYPVKLSYYEEQPLETEPYLPNKPFSQKDLLANQKNPIKWENIPSGIQLNQTYFFGVVDMFGQIVYDDNSSLLNLYPQGLTNDQRNPLSSLISVEARNGLYLLSDFKISFNIDDYNYVTFTSSAVQDQRIIPLDEPLVSTSSLEVQIHFRKCGRGEIVINEENATICGECQPGLWQTSLEPNALACKPCQDTSTICLGGDNVGPKKGYWRFNESADIVLLCPVSSCLGNEIIDQKESLKLDPVGKCEYGYKGNLCSNCISGWAKTDSGLCISCEKNVWFYIKLIITLTIQYALIIQGFRETINLCKDYSKDKVTKLHGAILIRILTNYLQLISLISSIQIEWPSVIKSLSEAISEIASVNKNLFSIDCMFTSEEIFGIKIIFWKLLLDTMGGLMLAFLSVIFWIIYFIIKRRKIFGNKRFVNNVLTTIIVICFMMQPSAIQSSFSFFKCANLYREDAPIQYFSKDYDVKCWEGAHLYWTVGLGVPSLLIWSLFLPLLVFNQIRRNKKKLTTQQISQKYSFLYGGYESSKYYWEFIIMIRKFIFIGVIISASFYSIALEIYLSIFLISLFYYIHSMSNPYSDPQFNFIEKLSLLCAVTINFCGLYFQYFGSIHIVLDFAFLLIGLTANLIFIGAFIRFYFSMRINRIKDTSKIYKKIVGICKKIRKCICSTKVLQRAKTKQERLVQTQGQELQRLSPRTAGKSPKTDSPESPNPILNEMLSRKGSRNHESSRSFSNFDNLSINQEDVSNNEISPLSPGHSELKIQAIPSKNIII